MLDMSQYRKIFVEEAREYLENLTRILLAWEKEPADKTKVQEVFRIAHTLKGMAATLDLEHITTLTHQLENLLDLVRQEKVQPEQSLFDLLLVSLDTLESLIKAVEENAKPDPETTLYLLKRMEELVATACPDPEGEAPSENGAAGLNEHENLVASQALAQGMQVFSVGVWLEPDCLLKRARVYVILQGLEGLGEIIKTDPPVEELEEEQFGEHFTVFLVSRAGKEEIERTMTGLAEIRSFTIDFPKVNEKKAAEKPDKDGKDTGPLLNDERRLSSRQTVRVGIDRLDQLMNLVGELVIAKTRLEQLLSFQSSIETEEVIKSLGRISANLQDVVMQARMVPVAQVFNRFPRMVRDLARELNKEVEFVVKGEDTELDRRVIDELADPLVHLIRNALDHGLESREDREAAGKAPVGQLVLEAFYEGSSVIILLRDDGRGIDLQNLRSRALERGIITGEESREWTREQLLDLIFSSGFSTATQVSSVSGRGVGLDVVRAKIESLNGDVSLETEAAVGTTFRIRLPLTLAIIQALLIQVGVEVYALPLERVEEIRRTSTSDIRYIQGREVISIRGQVLPLIRVHKLLQVPDGREVRNEFFSVIVKTEQQRAALVVDSLVGQREIVIKSLGRLLVGLPALAGATILGDGRVALILDVGYFLAGCKGEEAKEWQSMTR